MLIKLFIAFLLLVLFVRFFFFYQKSDIYQDGQDINFEATLLSEPQFTPTYQKLSVSLPSGGTAYLIISRFPEYGYGDRVDISGPIRILHRSGGLRSSSSEGGPYGASSQIFKLLTDKPTYSMYFPKISLAETEQTPILAVSIFIRQKVTELFNKTLSPDLSSLLLGIVFGIKGQMSKEFANNLRLAGVLHVIAASGMNVTMVAGFLSSVFVIFLKRQEALFASILGIVFYAFLAGLQPSIIRASIMGVLVFSSQILGRQNFAAYGLFLTGFLMLFVSPFLI
ncbi:MAG: ComEC/Rec2 family competence protein, partial [Patescibacteria group bacterium]|nr:ComEC/Rec2 family competence protein [Patescibacteria group bacterium]